MLQSNDLGSLAARSASSGHVLQLPPWAWSAATRAIGLVDMGGVDRVDLKPPGVRDQLPGAVMPYQSFLQRGSAVDTTRPGAAPLILTDTRPPFLSSAPYLQQAEEQYHVLQETPIAEHVAFARWGQWSVPYTGFSRLRDITPYGTSHFV